MQITAGMIWVKVKMERRKIGVNRIKLWISKFICKWSDFAGLGNDKDILELKKSIKAYENGIAKRKEMERDNQ